MPTVGKKAYREASIHEANVESIFQQCCVNISSTSSDNHPRHNHLLTRSQLPRARTATWMGDLGSAIIGHVPFCQLKMVGTHNSGTSAMNSTTSDISGDGTKALLGLPWGVRHLAKSVTTPWARTQSLSLLEQLEAGYRYLDLRLITNEAPWRSEAGNFDIGELWVAHGLFSIPHRTVIDQVLTFARRYPKEIFILDYNRLLELDEEHNEHSMGDDLTRARKRHSQRRERVFGSSGARAPPNLKTQSKIRQYSREKREDRMNALNVIPQQLDDVREYHETTPLKETIQTGDQPEPQRYDHVGHYCHCANQAAHCDALLFDDEDTGCSNYAEETPLRRLLRDLQPLMPHIIPRTADGDGGASSSAKYAMNVATMNDLWAIPCSSTSTSTPGTPEASSGATESDAEATSGSEPNDKSSVICQVCHKRAIRPTIFLTFPTQLKQWLHNGISQMRSNQSTNNSTSGAPLGQLTEFPLPSSPTLRKPTIESRMNKGGAQNGNNNNEGSPTTLSNPIGGGSPVNDAEVNFIEAERSSAHSRMLSGLRLLTGAAANTARDSYLNQIWHNRRTPEKLMDAIKGHLANELKEEMLQIVEIRERELLLPTATGISISQQQQFQTQGNATLSATAVVTNSKQFYRSNGPSKVFVTGTIITIGATDVVRGILTCCFRGFASPVCCWNRSLYKKVVPSSLLIAQDSANVHQRQDDPHMASSSITTDERFRVPLIHPTVTAGVVAEPFSPHSITTHTSVPISAALSVPKDLPTPVPRPATCCNNTCGAGIFHVARDANNHALVFFHGLGMPFSVERWEVLMMAVDLAMGTQNGGVVVGGGNASQRKELLTQLAEAHWGSLCCCHERNTTNNDDGGLAADYGSGTWWWAEPMKESTTTPSGYLRPRSCLWCRSNADRNILQLDYAEDACIGFEDPTSNGDEKWEETAVEVCIRATIRYALATR